MSSAEEHSANRSGGRVLARLAVVFCAVILALVAWFLLKPAFAAASSDVPPGVVTDSVQAPAVASDNALYGVPVNPHPVVGDGSTPLNCLSCHEQTLNFHDVLGVGNQACYACHVSTDLSMKNLQLASGAVISKDDSSQLCGQCHADRYTAWSEGTHGIPGTVAAVPCVACHDPHRPQVEFQNITRPPMPPVHTPPPLPKDWVIILGISIGCLLAGAVYFARRRQNE